MTRRRSLAGLAILCGLAVPVAAQTPGLNPSFLVGNWSEARECNDLIQYRADGTYRTSHNDQGRWTLEGNRLTMRSRSAAVLAVRVVNRNEIEVRLVGARETAVPGRSFRCRSRGRPAR